MDKGFHNYLTCVGVTYGGVVYMPKHRDVDGLKHYSAGICTPCVELTRKLRISKNLSANGLERELEKAFDHKGGIPLYGKPQRREDEK